MNNLQLTGEGLLTLKLNRESERITALHERPLSRRTPDSLTSSTLHGAESEPRCNRPAWPTSTRECFRLNPMTVAPVAGIIPGAGACQSQLAKWLELAFHQGPYLFHAFAVDAEIAVAGAGSRSKMNRLRGFLEEKLHVVDEAEQQTGELIMQV